MNLLYFDKIIGKNDNFMRRNIRKYKEISKLE